VSVDTEIQGKPAGIEGAADWLRGTFADAVGAAADQLNAARRTAESSWRSTAGEEFGSSMTKGRDKVDDLEDAAKTMAGDLDDFAGKLRGCQEDMATIRSDATAAGLTVSGFLVQDPGPGPARPEETMTGTPDEVEQGRRSWSAYNDHQDLRRAYQHACSEAARIDRKYATACRDLQDDYTVGEHAAWLLNVADVLGDTAGGAIGVTIGIKQSKLNIRAQDLVTEAKRAVAELQAHPERYLKRKWIFLKKLDATKLEADRLAIAGKLDEAEKLARTSRLAGEVKLPKYLGRAGKILGPLGLGLGIYNDYQEGESTTQIAVSQGVSTAAGIGAAALTGAGVGAAVGSVIPVAGTAVGAVVGTAVGAGVAIFTDGAIDSLFENGPDVGKAASEGWDAIEDTGEAIGDGISSAADTVGGWFS